MPNHNNFHFLIEKISGNNFFQYRMFASFMTKWVLAAMLLFSLNFFYYVPDFECTDDEMAGYETCEDFVCSVEDQDFWLNHMQKPLPRSISLDYGTIMVCSKEWVASLLQSIGYFGSLIGYIIMPLVADNKGRKTAQFISWFITVLGCGVLLISMNLPLIGIGSFLMGFGSNSATILHYSFIKELVVDKLGQKMMIFLQISFSFGVFFIAFTSWLISDWKYNLGMITTVGSLVLLLTNDWIEETPEFSLAKGKNILLSSLNKISSTNKGQTLNEEDLQTAGVQCQRNKQNKELTFIDLFKYKSLIKLTIICALIDFIIEFTYDGTILSLDKLGINIYFDQMFVGVVEIGASIFASYVINKVERKRYCRVSFGLVSVFTAVLGVLAIVERHDGEKVDVVTVLEMVVLGCLRVTLNAVWGIFFVFIAELYPAEITSVSFGWINIVGTIGATISPFIRLATAQLTLFLMAVLNIVNFILIQRLNETKDREIRFRIQERQTQEASTEPITEPIQSSIISEEPLLSSAQ